MKKNQVNAILINQTRKRNIILSATSIIIAVAIFAVTFVMVILGLALGKFLEKKPKTLGKSISALLFLALAIKSIIA